MPILIALVSGLLGWGLIWFIRFDGHLWMRDQFSERRREARRRQNRELAERAAATTITDPRDAALALMIKLGSADGAVLPAVEPLLAEINRDLFHYGEAFVEKRSFAGFVAGNTPTFSILFREVADILEKRLSRAEREQLVELLGQVALTAGGLTSAREAAIEEVRMRLLSRRPDAK